jgi:hypothetical protein
MGVGTEASAAVSPANSWWDWEFGNVSRSVACQLLDLDGEEWSARSAPNRPRRWPATPHGSRRLKMDSKAGAEG